MSNCQTPTKSRNPDAEWDLPLIIELAKSDRSECGVCKTNITKDELRVGTQTFFFKRGPVVKWHHVQCALAHNLVQESDLHEIDEGPRVTAASDITTLEIRSARKPMDEKKLWRQFCGAARAAVYMDVKAHREKVLEENPSAICPITGSKLDRETSHVHHSGPQDFNSIVNEFYVARSIDLTTLSFTANQFSSPILRSEFREFHRQKCRLLLVHEQANLSTLKKRPSLAPCDICGITKPMHWIFQHGMCKTCQMETLCGRKKGPVLSQSGCQREFGLRPDEVKHLVYQAVDNHVNKAFKPMKLFQRHEVETVVAKKYGSLQKAKKRRKQVENQMIERRRKEYLLAANYHMQSRSGFRPVVATTIEDKNPNFATPPQLALLVRFGITPPAGVTNKDAQSLLIQASRGRKRRLSTK